MPKTPLEYESIIRKLLLGQKLDGALLALRANSRTLKPFVAAGVGLFCVRFCRPLNSSDGPSLQMGQRAFEQLARVVEGYLLADPLSFDTETIGRYRTTAANPVFVLLRHFGNQASYGSYSLHHCPRSLILFGECPQRIAGIRNVPRFDFAARFFESNGATIEDFVAACSVAVSSAASNAHLGFHLGYFENARKNYGMALPEQKTVRTILKNISADATEFNRVYEREKRRDRMFAAYDHNPIFRFPLIRPWKTGPFWSRMLAPLPELVAMRAGMGIYHQMRRDYPNFTNYFGHLFEDYVGIVLDESRHPQMQIMSEREIRKAYPIEQGKCPDWIVLEGNTAILFECKATNFRPDALATGQEEAINGSLHQVKKGLIQLHEFITACKSKHPLLEPFWGCTKFHPVIVTFETLHLINSGWFREHIDGLISDATGEPFPWHIIEIEQMERFQPQARAGQSFERLFDAMNQRFSNDVMKEIEKETGVGIRQSFLWKREVEILRGLGANDEIISQLGEASEDDSG
ncbi:MAG: hypothetical protein KY445_06315 [Armatimonadetes bacterium]|nr:hypothetical protein [Armatimonadota bacterium]